MVKLDSAKYKRYLDEMGSRYPFTLEMVNLYKGLIDIWGDALPDDLSLLFSYKPLMSRGLTNGDDKCSCTTHASDGYTEPTSFSGERPMNVGLTNGHENPSPPGGESKGEEGFSDEPTCPSGAQKGMKIPLPSGERARVRGLFSDERLSKGIHMLDKGRVGTIDFTNTVNTTRKIFNLLKEQGKYIDIPPVDTSTRDILEFIENGLSREDRFTNIILKWILKPSFSHTLEEINVDTTLWNKGKCPLCCAPPGMALILDAELKRVSNVNRFTGEQRLLSCCFCGYRWTYALVGCPACGNDRPERLGFFVAESGSDQGTRAVSCEECRTYIKTSYIRCRGDQAKHLELDMDVEDVITLTIDIMANQRGYRALCQGYPQSSCK